MSIKWGNWLHQSIELQFENLWFRFGAKRHLKYTFPSISKLVANSWSNFCWNFASSVSICATEMFIVECYCGIQFRDLFNIKSRSGRQSILTPVRLFWPRSWKWKKVQDIRYHLGWKCHSLMMSNAFAFRCNLSMIWYFIRMACNKLLGWSEICIAWVDGKKLFRVLQFMKWSFTYFWLGQHIWHGIYGLHPAGGGTLSLLTNLILLRSPICRCYVTCTRISTSIHCNQVFDLASLNELQKVPKLFPHKEYETWFFFLQKVS